MEQTAPAPMSLTPDEWASRLKLGAAALGLVAAAWKLLAGPVTAWRKRRADDAELREASLELTRKTADAVRFKFIQEYGSPGDPGFLATEPAKLRRSAALFADLCEARKRFWKAIGMPDPEEDSGPPLSSEEKRLLLGWRQTMRLEARDLDPEKRKALLAARAAELVTADKPTDRGAESSDGNPGER